MAGLLGTVALVVLVFGLVNLVRPTGWLGVSDKRRAGLVVGASFVLFLLAALLSQPDDEGSQPTTESSGTTTSMAATTSTQLPATTAPESPATTSGESPATTGGDTTTSTESPPSHPEAAFDPPAAGPSGDPGGQLPSSAEVVIVVEVIDGDTLDVIRPRGDRDTVRLIGINSPERGECWSAEATSVLTVLTAVGAEIGMTVDESDRDRFGRLLRYLWVGSMSVNEELVRRGAALGRRYPPDTSMADRLDVAQDDARAGDLGIWAPDACGPSADADLRIVEWRPDAAGNDNENLNDEWIRIGNQGDTPVDLTGWGLKDESAVNRYSFPRGFTLAPGEVVTVYSGCGEGFATSLYWCSVGSAIWNNDGDTAFLTDPSGNTHTTRTYSP